MFAFDSASTELLTEDCKLRVTDNVSNWFKLETYGISIETFLMSLGLTI